jgi:hydroxyacylglutathione hydrolase
MEIKSFVLNPFQMNCYLYWDEFSLEGMLIDPGAYDETEEESIIHFIKSKNVNIKYIINTHGHIDHILGNSFAKSEFKAPLFIHKDDEFLVKNAMIQSQLFGLEIAPSQAFDGYVSDNQILNLGSNKIQISHTPGHSPGSVSIIDKTNKIVITGDVLFKGSIGRTDLEGGDIKILLDSIIGKIFEICDDDFIVYPGHSDSTKIGYEKKFNSFLN